MYNISFNIEFTLRDDLKNMNSKINILIIVIMVPFFVISIISLVSPHHSTHAAAPVKTVEVNPSNQSLGNADYGNVVKMGPYGNTSSPIKIAIIVGVHPLEYVAHDMAMESIETNIKSLKYCYYIYRVNVTEDPFDYETGRMNGQLLANQFVVPDITNNSYKLTVDIHSNTGEDDNYDVAWFLNVPIDDNKSSELMNQIIGKVPGLVSYDPMDPTSPYYVTIPIIENGTPAMIYESYAYDTPDVEQNRMNEVLSAVDNLSFN